MNNIHVSFICDTQEKKETLGRWLVEGEVQWCTGNFFKLNDIPDYIISIDFGYNGENDQITRCSNFDFIIDNSQLIYEIFDKNLISSYLCKNDKYKYPLIDKAEFMRILSVLRSDNPWSLIQK